MKRPKPRPLLHLLLACALLFAQAVSGWHLLRHATDPGAVARAALAPSSADGVLDSLCGDCLAGAAVAAAAPLPAPAGVAPAGADGVDPVLPEDRPADAPGVGYRSRAPPATA